MMSPSMRNHHGLLDFHRSSSFPLPCVIWPRKRGYKVGGSPLPGDSAKRYENLSEICVIEGVLYGRKAEFYNVEIFFYVRLLRKNYNKCHQNTHFVDCSFILHLQDSAEKEFLEIPALIFKPFRCFLKYWLQCLYLISVLE